MSSGQDCKPSAADFSRIPPARTHCSTYVPALPDDGSNFVDGHDQHNPGSAAAVHQWLDSFISVLSQHSAFGSSVLTAVILGTHGNDDLPQVVGGCLKHMHSPLDAQCLCFFMSADSAPAQIHLSSPIVYALSQAM